MNLFFALALLSQGPMAEIDRICLSEVDKGVAPSISVAIVQDQKVLHAAGYGWADIEKKVPATPETVYYVGSVTKQFTAMAMMILEEEGKLSVDDRLSAHLPNSLPAGERVTLRQVLNHTSGLQSITKIEGVRERYKEPPPLDEVIRVICNEPFMFEPGEQFSYGIGYLVAGAVVEQISGSSFPTFLKERIFDPLGMNDSAISTRENNDHPDMAVGYERDASKKGWNVAAYQPVWFSGGGGALMSNAGDLARWAAALHAKKLVSPETYERMEKRGSLNDGSLIEYGFGWRLPEPYKGQTLVNHGGGGPGFISAVVRLTSMNLTVVVLTNGNDFGHMRFFRKLASVLLQ